MESNEAGASAYIKLSKSLEDGSAMDLTDAEMAELMSSCDVKTRVEIAIDLREGWVERKLTNIKRNVIDYENTVDDTDVKELEAYAIELKALRRMLRG